MRRKETHCEFDLFVDSLFSRVFHCVLGEQLNLVVGDAHTSRLAVVQVVTEPDAAPSDGNQSDQHEQHCQAAGDGQRRPGPVGVSVQLAGLDDRFERYAPTHETRTEQQHDEGDKQDNATDDRKSDQIHQPSRIERLTGDDVETALD